MLTEKERQGFLEWAGYGVWNPEVENMKIFTSYSIAGHTEPAFFNFGNGKTQIADDNHTYMLAQLNDYKYPKGKLHVKTRSMSYTYRCVEDISDGSIVYVASPEDKLLLVTTLIGPKGAAWGKYLLDLRDPKLLRLTPSSLSNKLCTTVDVKLEFKE